MHNTNSGSALRYRMSGQVIFTEHLTRTSGDAPDAAAASLPGNRQRLKSLSLTSWRAFEEIFMAGHSKWANTRHRKAAQDASAVKSSLNYS